MPDNVLAKQLGVRVYIVSHRRRRLKIPRAPKLHPHGWKPKELALVGTKPDAEVARLIGRSRLAVANRRFQMHLPPVPDPNSRSKPWSSKEDRRLGTMSDEDLARQLGRTANAIEARRISFQIPKFAGRRHYWTAAEIEMLGRLPDAEVARRLGVSIIAVQIRRFKLGRKKLPGIQSRPTSRR